MGTRSAEAHAFLASLPAESAAPARATLAALGSALSTPVSVLSQPLLHAVLRGRFPDVRTRARA